MSNKTKPAYKKLDFINERPRKIIEVTDFLRPYLNELHGVEYSERYWLSILKSYAVFCINIEPFLIQEGVNWNIPMFPINKWQPLTFKECVKSELIRKIKEVRKNDSLNNFASNINKVNDVVYGLRGNKIAKALNVNHVPSPSIVFLWRKDKQKREKVVQFAGQQENTFFKNILNNLPRAYVEYYDYIDSLLPKISKPENKVFHREHGAGILFNFLVAKAVEFGAKVYEYQLGAYIGETLHSVSEFKYMTIDKHLTYGWQYHEKDEPYYAIRLEEFNGEYVVQNCQVKRDITIVYNKVSKQNKNRYLDLTEYLNSNLSFKKYSTIHLRPRGVSKKVNNQNELSFLKHMERFVIDTGREPMFRTVAKSRIMVHWNIPATNFLECIFVNHPVIGLLTNNNPTEIIKPYYDYFLRKGVLHKNVENLVEHLNNVDIEVWWKDVINDDFFLEFKNTFARSEQTYLQSIS